MDRRLQAFDVLLELTRALTDDRVLEEALGAVTEATMRLLPGEHASIRLIDDTGSELLCGARSGVGSHARPMTFRRGEGVAGWVVETGRIANVVDTTDDPRFLRSTGQQGFEIGSILAVPLWSAGRVVGVLAVTSSRKGAFSSEDEDVLRLLGNCAVPPVEKARLERLAMTDAQTRAFNVRYLLPRLREEMERARRFVTPMAILVMDLDHLGKVNDELGHGAGDLVLRAFSDRVRQRVRRPDVLVRRGGAEFVLVMPGTRIDEALRVGDRVRRALEADPVDLGEGRRVAQTVSVGAAAWDGVESAEELEERANLAMHEAKKLGRNRVCAAPQPSAEPG